MRSTGNRRRVVGLLAIALILLIQRPVVAATSSALFDRAPTSPAPAPPPAAQSYVPPPDVTTVGWCDSKFTGWTCNLPGKAFGGVVGGAVGAVTQWVTDGAVGVLQSISDRLLKDDTNPDLSSSWFTPHYRDMARLGGILLLPVLLIAIVHGLVRRDPLAIVSACLMRVPLALLFTGVAVTLVTSGITATNVMTTSVAGNIKDDLVSFVGNVSAVMTLTGPAPLPSFVIFGGALLIAISGFLVGIELLIREDVIYIAVLFLPLVASAAVWPAVTHWVKKLSWFLFAAVISKLVIFGIFAAGVGALAATAQGGGLSALLTGVTVLFMAVFVPAKLVSWLPMLEAAASVGVVGGATSGITRTGVRATETMAIRGGRGGGSDSLPVFGGEGAPAGAAALGGGAAAGAAAGGAAMAVIEGGSAAAGAAAGRLKGPQNSTTAMGPSGPTSAPPSPAPPSTPLSSEPPGGEADPPSGGPLNV